MDTLVEKIAGFINKIGIEISFQDLEEQCFLPGISIRQGMIAVDLSKLENPGDLLHEAGHIAVVPKSERHTLTSDSIAQRPHQAAEEMMAIAWSYAALKHLELDPSIVFHENGYKGGAENLLYSFEHSNSPIGVPMLQYHGLTFYGNRAIENNAKPYPAMVRWTLE